MTDWVLDIHQVGTPPVCSHTGTTYTPLNFPTWQKNFGHSSGGNTTPFVVLVHTYPSSTLFLCRTRVLKSGGNFTPLLLYWYTHTPPQLYSCTGQEFWSLAATPPLCCCAGTHIPLSTLLSYKGFGQSGGNSTPLLLLYTHTHLNVTLLQEFWTVRWELHPFVVVIHTYTLLHEF